MNIAEPIEHSAATGRPFAPGDILCKTPKGFEEARKQTAESGMPRRLRSLLMVVDGKSPFKTYVDTLNNHGDVGELYQALEEAGYISRIPAPGGRAASAPRQRQSVGVSEKDLPVRRPAATKVAAPADDPQIFAELVGHITNVVSDELGGDALELLLALEALETPADLMRLTPVLEQQLARSMDRKALKKFVSSVRAALI